MYSLLDAVVHWQAKIILVIESDDTLPLCAVVENQKSVAFSFDVNLYFDSPSNSASVLQ